jgi:hypothetical protein
MKIVNNQFVLFANPDSASLCIDEVFSCIVDEKVFGTVCVGLSISSAEQLGSALLEFAKAARMASAIADESAQAGELLSPARVAINAALAAARAASIRPCPPWEDA